MGTYWPWETTAALRSARRREALRRPQREERVGHVAAARLQLVLTVIDTPPQFLLKTECMMQHSLNWMRQRTGNQCSWRRPL